MTDQYDPDDRPIDDEPVEADLDPVTSDPFGDDDAIDPAPADDLDDLGPDDDIEPVDDDEAANGDDDTVTGGSAAPITLHVDAEDADDDDADDDGDDVDDRHEADDGGSTSDAPVVLAEPTLDDGYDVPTLAALADLGDVDPAALQATLRELGLDEAVDARSTVVALERLGVETRVAFGDIDAVARLLADGATVRLGDATLVSIDDRADDAIVRHPDGRQSRVPLEDLEARWADHGYEFVVGTHNRAVLPVTLPSSLPPDDGGGISG